MIYTCSGARLLVCFVEAPEIGDSASPPGERPLPRRDSGPGGPGPRWPLALHGRCGMSTDRWSGLPWTTSDVAHPRFGCRPDVELLDREMQIF